MAMTKKDYQFFADLNKEMVYRSPNWVEDGLSYQIVQQGKYFWKDNPRFDPKRFLVASGVPDLYHDNMIHKMGVWK